jgi:release factor glutamine methyltransferase
VTVAESINRAERVLAAYGLDDARFEAEVLLRHVLGIDRAGFYASPQRELDRVEWAAFARFIQRRVDREPTAYIVGHKEFYALDLRVAPPVLIPRPETELLVETAIEVAGKHYPLSCLVADVGTGCGVYAIDVSSAALEIAKVNCRSHGVEERVTLLHGDLLQPLPESVHLIVANLPYVRSSEMGDLSPEISSHEPELALHGGLDGLDAIRQLLSQVKGRLLGNGFVLVEIGHDQAQAVCDLAVEHLPGSTSSVVADLSGLDRVVKIAPGR